MNHAGKRDRNYAIAVFVFVAIVGIGSLFFEHTLAYFIVVFIGMFIFYASFYLLSRFFRKE